MDLTVGAAQNEPSRGDVAENIEKHVQLARLAAKHDVQALVFPELSLTGYELDLAERLAFSENDHRLEPLRGSASDHHMVLVVGAPVRLPTGLHIGAFIVYPSGRVAIYTKHHLGGDEGRVFQPLDRDPLVELTTATAAVAICADTNHASHARNAATRGATVYLAGVLFPPSEFELLATNDVGEPILATPAICGDRIYLRTENSLWCIGDRPAEAQAGGEL